jgi:hypothetical protein
MISLATALKSLYPTSEFAIEDNDIGKIRWFKDQPEGFQFSDDEVGNELKAAKLAELQVEVDRLTQIEISKQYQQKRRYEYPPLADLADALYWQSQGDESKMTAYLAAVDAVKQKYPKEGE